MIEIIVTLCFFAVLAFVFFGKPWTPPRSKPADAASLRAYETRPNIFVNRSEHRFFEELLKQKPDGFHVFIKVRLEDVLQVRHQIKDTQKHWQYRARIKSRHVDYVICHDSGVFTCAIELDGSTHTSKEAVMVDGFKDGIFANAGLTLYRVQTGENFQTRVRAIWHEIQNTKYS